MNLLPRHVLICLIGSGIAQYMLVYTSFYEFYVPSAATYFFFVFYSPIMYEKVRTKVHLKMMHNCM